jgi:hypothetical protein
MSKKVLIIAYYWPPSGGSGVQRWLKFVKYLPQFGWEPYVFTPENPSFTIRDESLLKDVPVEAEVIRFPSGSPMSIFRSFRVLWSAKVRKPYGFCFNKKPFLISANKHFYTCQFFYTRPAGFWVRPSVKFLNDFLKENGIRTIITTGPPHSIHLIGYNLKKKNPSLRWLADFRDPWSEWGLLDSLKVSAPIRNIHRKLEAKVLRGADKITTITPFYV